MDQRIRVNQLDAESEVRDRPALSARRPVRGHQQERPDPLARAEHGIAHGLRDPGLEVADLLAQKRLEGPVEVRPQADIVASGSSFGVIRARVRRPSPLRIHRRPLPRHPGVGSRPLSVAPWINSSTLPCAESSRSTRHPEPFDSPLEQKERLVEIQVILLQRVRDRLQLSERSLQRRVAVVHSVFALPSRFRISSATHRMLASTTRRSKPGTDLKHTTPTKHRALIVERHRIPAPERRQGAQGIETGRDERQLPRSGGEDFTHGRLPVCPGRPRPDPAPCSPHSAARR